MDKSLDLGVDYGSTDVLADVLQMIWQMTDVKLNVFFVCCVMRSACQRDAAQLPHCM